MTSSWYQTRWLVRLANDQNEKTEFANTSGGRMVAFSASSVTPAIEGGQFWLLEGAAWSRAYRAELTAFPGGAHDDFVDATVQPLTYLRANPEPSIITYYKDLAGTARIQIEQLRNRRPQISDAELRRCSHEAGSCAMRKVNLLGQQSIRNGLGQVCMPCAKKHEMNF